MSEPVMPVIGSVVIGPPPQAVLTFLGLYLAVGVVVLLVGLSKTKGPDPLGSGFWLWGVILWPLAVLKK
jgi:hypothetical protein